MSDSGEHHWERKFWELHSDAKDLRELNAKLVAALTELSLCDSSDANVANAEVLATRVRKVAREALADQQPQGPKTV